LLRFDQDKWSPTYITTIGIDVTSKPIDLELPNGDRTRALVKCWDTAGQERFRAVSQRYLRKCQGAFLVYDVTDEASFSAVSEWMMQISSDDGSGKQRIPLMLVANKADCTGDKRKVSEEQGRAMAARIESGVPYIETSAASGLNVKEAFALLAASAAAWKLSLPKSKRPPAVKPSKPTAREGGCCKG
jgi:Ras-related protein Rab-8A